MVPTVPARRGVLEACALAALLVTVPWWTGSATGRDAGPADKWEAKLRAPLEGWLREALVPGAAVAVIEDGRIAWQGAFGTRSAATGEPVTEATVFEAASLSKPVFAYAVMKLVDKGTIRLDRPLAEYLAGTDLAAVYPPAAAGDARWKAITARMVLTHSTGFPNWFGGSPMRFLFDPGQRFSYSGEAYSLLAAAVAAAAGRSFDELLQDLVFAPLGMTSSSYVWRPDYETRVTRSHDRLGKTTERRRSTRALPGASLYTTVGDYARFLAALGSGEGLARQTWLAMTSPQIQVLDREGRPCFSWGFGVGVHASGGDTALWHWGDNGDLNAYFEIVPRRKLGVIMFLNGANAHAVTPLVTRQVLGVAVPAISTSYFRYAALDSPAMAMARAFRARGIAGALDVASANPERLKAADSVELQGLLVLSDAAVEAGDLAGARAALDFVIERLPASAPAHSRLGGVRLAQGDRAGMEASFEKALSIEPNQEGRLNSLGYTLLRLGRLDEAVVVFEYNTRKYPLSANVYDSLAEALEKKGDRRQAIRNYARALSLGEPDPSSSSYQALKRLLSEAEKEKEKE